MKKQQDLHKEKRVRYQVSKGVKTLILYGIPKG